MNVQLYSFSKRENSTKQPTGGESIACHLKENTSIYYPSFKLTSQNMLRYNYLKWNDFYYYISDIISIGNNQWQVDCRIDVLASFKEEIKNTNAFIKYASVGYDIGLPDLRLSTNDNVIVNSTKKKLFNGLGEGYVVTYVGEQATTNPCVGLNSTGLTALMDAIQSNAFAELLYDPSNALSKILSDCSSAITSCKYMPVIGTEGSKNIVLAGGYNTNISGNVVSEMTPNNVPVDIPWNFEHGDFRNRSQYTSLFVYLPGYGFIQLNTDDYIGYDFLQVDALLDSTSGGLTYLVGHNTRAECNISTPIQISTTTQGNAIGAVVSAGASLVSGLSGNIPGAIGATFGAITSSMISNVGSVGSQGSHSSYSIDRYIHVICISHDTNVNPNNMSQSFGRPCNKVKSIESGYNECVNASVSCNASDDIIQKINDYMNGGFYYE